MFVFKKLITLIVSWALYSDDCFTELEHSVKLNFLLQLHRMSFNLFCNINDGEFENASVSVLVPQGKEQISTKRAEPNLRHS